MMLISFMDTCTARFNDSVYDNSFHFYKSHHLVHAVKAFTSNMDKALII